MDYKRAKKQLKKIKTLLESFESLGEPMTEMEARLLRKYADEFKLIVPHFEEEVQPTVQPKVESAIINLKGDIQEKELPVVENIEELVADEYDIPPVKEIEKVVEVETITAEPVIEAKKAAPKVIEKVTKKVAEPVKKAVKKTLVADHDEAELGSISLWDPVVITELSQKLSFSPIKNVFKSISINERIFTQNELFNGDNLSFRATLEKIEEMNSFEDASAFLKNGVASENNWADPKKIKKAKEFMKLVQRRFI